MHFSFSVFFRSNNIFGILLRMVSKSGVHKPIFLANFLQIAFLFRNRSQQMKKHIIFPKSNFLRPVNISAILHLINNHALFIHLKLVARWLCWWTPIMFLSLFFFWKFNFKNIQNNEQEQQHTFLTLFFQSFFALRGPRR